MELFVAKVISIQTLKIEKRTKSKCVNEIKSKKGLHCITSCKQGVLHFFSEGHII